MRRTLAGGRSREIAEGGTKVSAEEIVGRSEGVGVGAEVREAGGVREGAGAAVKKGAGQGGGAEVGESAGKNAARGRSLA